MTYGTTGPKLYAPPVFHPYRLKAEIGFCGDVGALRRGGSEGETQNNKRKIFFRNHLDFLDFRIRSYANCSFIG